GRGWDRRRHRAPPAAQGPGADVRCGEPGTVRRPRNGRRPGPIRQRAPGSSEHVPERLDRVDRQVSDVVVTQGLVNAYPGTLAVAGLDLNVESGDIFGLVGPNGAGKTTTLRI